MEIPKEIGNLKSLKEREGKAHAESQKWESILSDVYEFFLPNRNLFNREDVGQNKMDRIFDGTAQEAIKLGASKLQDNIAPIWSIWANFEPSNEVIRALEDQDEVSESDIRENLEKQRDIIFDILNRSNFGTQFYEFALDLLIGTASMMIESEESIDMPISFKAVPQIGLAIEEGPNGNVETHWWKLKVKARNIERQWPGFKPSPHIAKVMTDSPDSNVDIRQGVIFSPTQSAYHMVVWVHEEDKASFVMTYDESSPMVTARYSKTSGEVRGRGPCLDVLPDVKSLNKAKEFALTAAGMELSGAWTAVDDGITNPYGIVVSPGVVIPVGSNASSNPSLARLDTSRTLDLSMFVIEDMRQSIQKALFNDLREPDDSVVSATQYAIETRELAKRLGSAFGRLQTEALIPILKRVHFILKEKGIVQPISIGGREVSVKFTSPLARAQDAEDLGGVQQAVEFARAIGGDEAVQLAFKVENIGVWAGEKTGTPQELIRSKAEQDEMIKKASELAEQGVQEQPEQVA